jgi:hypothetical protein
MESSEQLPGEIVIAAGKAFPGALACQSPLDPLLMVFAQEAAAIQAQYRRQGHHDWDRRRHKILAAIAAAADGVRGVEEICAESWADHDGYPLEVISREMFESWRTSRGHWSVASRVHARLGAGMARGANGIWYATILVAD